MEIIQFPYRGYGVKVTPESYGWTAHLQFPGWKPEEFVELGNQFDRASDALQASMYWIDAMSVDLAVREVLSQEHRSDRLSLNEFNRLTVSVRQEAYRNRVPVRASKEAMES